MSDLVSAVEVAPQGWMRDARVAHVMALLNADTHRTLFVGGCVRHALLSLEVQDIDLATQYSPQEVIDVCADAGVKTVPTGIDHGTVSVVHEGLAFEVTTLRRDVETDGRRAVVAYTDDWVEDAQRRDFTMNTLLMDLDGAVFDVLGRGVADLRAGHVVFVGDAAQRIAEDALRILRFFRFFALYGVGDMDAAALGACRAGAALVEGLSRERITQELFKLVMAPQGAAVLEAMFACGVLRDLAFLDDLSAYQRFCDAQFEYEAVSLAGRLCGFTGASNTHLAHLYARLIIPKAVQKQIKAIQIAVHSVPERRDAHALKVFLYHHGRDATLQAVLWSVAQAGARTGVDRELSQSLDLIETLEVPVFPVTGADLMALGYPSGPELGRELRRLEEEWIAEGFPADFKDQVLSG